MFGVADNNSIIQNIGVVNGYIKVGSSSGGVVGQANGAITSCYNTGTVSGGFIVGGVVGFAAAAISSCYNTGVVSGTGQYVGGVAGNASAAISSCYNTGEVSCTGVGEYVGGVVGNAYDAISSCYNTGKVSGTGYYVGGVVGKKAYDGAISSCYNTGEVSCTGVGEYVGGVAGSGAADIISNCYNTGAVTGTGTNYIGGVAGNATTIVSCYSAGTVTINSTSTLKYTYYDSTGASGTFTNDSTGKATLLTTINSGSTYCAAPTQYAADGVFSAANPVNQGYPILEAFGYTGVDTNIETQMPKDPSDSTNKTYFIKNAYQMDLVRNYLETSGITFKLANNIDISPAQYNKSQDASGSWSPVGTGGSFFYASFDGNGNTISGIYINSTSDFQGLFGFTSTGSSIKNVGMTNGYVKGGRYIGSIAGNPLGTVVSCYNTGTVCGTGTNYVGGIAGSAGNQILNCYNTGAVSGTGSTVGGIVGLATAAISNSNNTGAVSSPSSAVGGIAGQANNAVSNCSNTGAVSGTGGSVGGVIGKTYSTLATIISCSNTGKVSSSGSNVGGVVGYAAAAISSCYNTGAVSGSVRYVGGVAGGSKGTLSNNYYCGYSGGVGQDQTTKASDVTNGTIPFISCKNSLSAGETTDISELHLEELNADFIAAFGISDIQYPDTYESSNSGILTVSGKRVTAITFGTASVNGKAGSNSNANIVITQNALNMTDALTGFSGAGTTKVSGMISLPFTVAASTNKQLQSIPAPSDITNIANGAAKTAEALNLPTTILLTTDNGTVGANVHWNVDASSYDASKTTAQTFVVTGTVTLPAGVDANGVSLSTSISVTVAAASGSGDSTNKIVSGFAPLSEAIKTQNAEYGSDFSILNLPKKLQVVGDEITGLWVKVTDWVCSTYDSTVAGIYRFTPVLDRSYVDSGYVDSGYVIGSGVSIPEITVTVKGKPGSTHNSNTNNTSSSPSATSGKTETKVDKASNTATVAARSDSVIPNGTTTQIETNVPSVLIDNTATSTAGDSVDTTKKSAVVINLPTDDIERQLAAKQNVELTVTVPSDVAKNTNENIAVTINAGKEILEAAKANLSDVTIRIKDVDTQQLKYSWTFRGADLAKSTAPMTDVNIAMCVRLTTEVPKVHVLTTTNTGLVLSFDHSGVLPAVASVKFSALEKGFHAGQTLYFYYYNPSTRQIDPLGSKYTVDADGAITVQILHCSDYVLLPNAVRSLTLDTKIYTMPVNNKYEIGIKLTNTQGTSVKVYSSTKGVASITKLKNGNYQVTGLKVGLTYIMFDVYDEKNRLIKKAHASVRLIIKNGVKPTGDSWRQTAIF